MASSKGRWKPVPPARAKNDPLIGGRGAGLDRLVVGDALGSAAIAGIATQHLGQGAGGTNARAHQQQVRPGPADLLQSFVEPKSPMQLGFGVDLKPLGRKAGESAEPLAAGLITDPDRQHGDAGGLQLRPYRHQGLGVFEAVEIAQLREEEHQPAAALPHSLHLRQPLQQQG